MRTDRLLFIIIIISVLIRYLWATLGWSGEFYIMFPVYIALVILLIWYYSQTENNFYRIVLLYFLLFIIGIALQLFEVKMADLFLFLGSLGFIMFSIYFIIRKKNLLKSKSKIWCFLLSICIIIQTVLYLFVASQGVLIVAHSLSFFIGGMALALVFRKEVEKDITTDEKNILSFIIIVNILSLLGITFKASFYSSLWI
jgi:hypothetical protein